MGKEGDEEEKSVIRAGALSSGMEQHSRKLASLQTRLRVKQRKLRNKK